MGAMKGFAYALEPHFIEEIEKTMGNPEMAASERYRKLTILGLDEYAISGSKLRKKKFPIKEEIGPQFTVMLPDAINKEIEKVKKNRKQIKKLAIRYIVLLGFEKWKRDNNIDDKIKHEPEQDKQKEIAIKEDTKKNELSEKSKNFIKKHGYSFDEIKKEQEQQQQPVSKDNFVSEIKGDDSDFIGKINPEKLQHLVDLIDKSNGNKDTSGSFFDLVKNKKINFNFTISLDDK